MDIRDKRSNKAAAIQCGQQHGYPNDHRQQYFAFAGRNHWQKNRDQPLGGIMVYSGLWILHGISYLEGVVESNQRR